MTAQEQPAADSCAGDDAARARDSEDPRTRLEQRYYQTPVAAAPPTADRERLPAPVHAWPGGQAHRPVAWRPAPFAEELHVVAAAAVTRFGGEPVAETVCAGTAYVNDTVRGGGEVWQAWPKCTGCVRGVGARAW